METGDSFDCPHCGKNTFLKKETVMEGWTRKGEVLKCVSCGAVIEELKEEKTEKKVSPLENDAALKFKSLLGEDAPVVLLPAWLTREKNTLKGVVAQMPTREDVDLPFHRLHRRHAEP